MIFNGTDFSTYFKNYPDADGYFGKYGGSYIPPELQAAMDEITEAYFTICKSSKFVSELRRIRREFQGRPTPVSYLERLSSTLGNVQLYVKREDLNHTGAHKLNHCMGEALLAKYMGKKKVIAETGAGQHGVALATAAAYFGLECDIYMGAVDIKKQAPNVARMKILGANVVEVTDGLMTLKEAVDAAFEAYMREYKDAIYCIGSVVGPHPFPMMVRDFQSVVGIEAREQFIEMTGELPDAVVACVGGGSNAIGMFSPFVPDAPVRLIGVEAGGTGEEGCMHSAAINLGRPGVLHGEYTMLLQDENEVVIQSTRSVRAGEEIGMCIGPDEIHVMPAGVLVNVFDGTITRDGRVAFAGGEYECDLTQICEGSVLAGESSVRMADGTETDLAGTEVTVEVPVKAVSMSDEQVDYRADGNIISFIYKGNHYNYTVRTATEDDFVLDEDDLWNEGDHVSLMIPKDQIILKRK